MKRFVLLLVPLAAGLAASIAFASPPGHNLTTSTTTTTHGPKSKCHPVNLRGTVSAGSISVLVTKADPHSSALKGTTVALTVTGNVAVKAVACGTGGTQTLTLRQLKSLAHPPQSGG